MSAFQSPIVIPPSWQRAAQLILKQRPRTVLLLGETDRGKSTFGAYLAALLLKEGLRVAYLDADPGQKVFGPPTTLTLGYPELDLPLSELRPEALYFIGDVSPRANLLLPMICGFRLLADRAREAPLLVVNTCGYVHGAGAVLQSYSIEILRPDVIVALQKGDEIEPLLLAHRHRRILRLETPPQVRTRPFEERRRHRLAAFRHHFREARCYAVPLRRFVLQRIFAKPLGEALARGRICAVGNLNQEILGLAVIERFEAAHARLWLKSAVPIPEMAVLQIGQLLVPELLMPPIPRET